MEGKRSPIAALALALAAAGGAGAAVVPAPATNTFGGLFLLNNTTGAISFCYVIINGARGCSTVAKFSGATVGTRLIASPGSPTYIVEPSTGQTMACYVVQYVGRPNPEPACLVLAPRLP